MRKKRVSPREVEVAGQSRDARENAHGSGVEVGPLFLPRADDAVNLVVRSWDGHAFVFTHASKILEIKTLVFVDFEVHLNQRR